MNASLARRIEKIEARTDAPADRALAERLERARARLAAYDAERGIIRPPRVSLVFPPHLTGIAERLAWARAQRRKDEASGPVS